MTGLLTKRIRADDHVITSCSRMSRAMRANPTARLTFSFTRMVASVDAIATVTTRSNEFRQRSVFGDAQQNDQASVGQDTDHDHAGRAGRWRLPGLVPARLFVSARLLPLR